jgi:hypothetical protein
MYTLRPEGNNAFIMEEYLANRSLSGFERRVSLKFSPVEA